LVTAMWFLQIRAPGWLQTCPSHENPDVAALGTIQPHHPIGRNAPVKGSEMGFADKRR